MLPTIEIFHFGSNSKSQRSLSSQVLCYFCTFLRRWDAPIGRLATVSIVNPTQRQRLSAFSHPSPRCGTGLAKTTTTSWLWGNIRITSDPSTGVSNVENRREHIPVHNFFRGECRVLHVCPVAGAHNAHNVPVSHTRRPELRPRVGYIPINPMVWPPHLLELL